MRSFCSESAQTRGTRRGVSSALACIASPHHTLSRLRVRRLGRSAMHAPIEAVVTSSGTSCVLSLSVPVPQSARS